MAARPIHDWNATGGAGAGDPAREAAFRAAFRHSRRVRRLRIAIPIVSMAIFGMVVFVSWWNPLSMLKLPVSIGSISVSGSKVTMEAPRLTGYTNDNRFYRVAASRAEHDIARAHIVTLSAIDAELEMEGGGTARVISSGGVLDTKTGQVELNQRVSVTTSNGQSGEAGHAHIDTRTGVITSNGPVELTSPRGRLFADRMAIRDNGKSIVLEGQVRGNFMPDAPDPAARTEPAGAPPDDVETRR